ncbi:DNA-binding transcriptional MocR family regulator [Streptomyces sp. SAI-127]|nr:DNA-binding transcriptional MocR family regulator [Streptomyces sp. SAI-127]
MPKPGVDPTVTLELSVDRSSPVPLYFQLSQQLEAAIEHGTLTPGSLLGNEIELAARLGLSRPTVRQAIQSLVDKRPAGAAPRSRHPGRTQPGQAPAGAQQPLRRP